LYDSIHSYFGIQLNQLKKPLFDKWHLFRKSIGMKEITRWIKQLPLELIFWMGSLIAIYFINPYSGDHMSLCPLDQLGFDWCPGCGLGRSMSLLLKGDFQESWSMHPLAMFAYLVIFSRIWTLINNLKTTHNYG
jgi:hypothetical protein